MVGLDSFHAITSTIFFLRWANFTGKPKILDETSKLGTMRAIITFVYSSPAKPSSIPTGNHDYTIMSARQQKRPAKRAKRLTPYNSDTDRLRRCCPLQYRTMGCIGRRMRSDPREGLYFNLPLVTYSDYHECFRNFKRIELDGRDRVQLARRAAREGVTSATYLQSRKCARAPRSETRDSGARLHDSKIT